jgi:hypothetical protein
MDRFVDAGRLWCALVVVVVMCFAGGPAMAFPSGAIEGAVGEALGQSVKLQLLEVPLDRALGALEKESGVRFVVDRVALGDLLEQPVEVESDAIEIRAALELALSQVGLEYIDYDVRAGVVVISTPAKVIGPRLVTRVYDARELTRELVHFNTYPKVGLWQKQSKDVLYSEHRPKREGAGASLFDDEDADETTVDLAGLSEGRLVSLIMNSVMVGDHAGNWMIQGVSIEIDKGLLLVVNTPEAQEGVKDLLTSYQAATGQQIGVQARCVLMASTMLDRFIDEEAGGLLVLDEAGVKAFRALAYDETNGVETLGVARTVCFNTQRVGVVVGHERGYVADVSPIVATKSAANDPRVAVETNMVVLAVRPTAGVDGRSVSLVIEGSIGLGGAEEMAMSERLGLSLPSKDSAVFRTSTRVPNGGGVLLTGGSAQFRHLRAEGKEVVLLVEARVVGR